MASNTYEYDMVGAWPFLPREAAMLARCWESSFCLSVRLSHACFVIKPNSHCGHFDTARKSSHSSFLTPTVVGGRRPLLSEICAQSDPPFFEKRRLRQISAYDISTVRYSEQSSIMINRKSTTSFPTSYRWSAYITLNSPKEWLKSV